MILRLPLNSSVCICVCVGKGNKGMGCCLVAKLCLTLCNSIDYNLPLPCSSVCEIFQAIILDWLPLPSPGNVPDLWIKPMSSELQVYSLSTSHQGSPGKGNTGVGGQNMRYCFPIVQRRKWGFREFK